MPGQESMMFYRGNRADAGFPANLAEVAAQFWASPFGRPHVEDPDHQGRLVTSLRLFLTNPHGFNSTWVDDAGFDELFTKVRETWPETCETCSGPLRAGEGDGNVCGPCTESAAGREAEGTQ